jgi:hypothetical protein
VLLCGSQEEILEVPSMIDLFSGVRLVLLLPDKDQENLAEAHRLHLRYIGYADGDLEDVSAVLGNMTRKIAVQ